VRQANTYVPDVRIQGRAAPQQAPQAPQQATTIRKGLSVYSDASDLAVEAVLTSGGSAPVIDIRTQLQKSAGCPSCRTSIPSWVSRCPECGVDLASGTLHKSGASSAVSGQPAIRAPGIRPAPSADVVVRGTVRLPKV
jgi:hypothetical protein